MKKLTLPDGLSVRPATAKDTVFLESLYQSTRDDLSFLDAPEEQKAELMEMQFRAQTQGYGDAYPNAMYFIIEKHQEAIGKATLDFGPNEVRLIDLALIPAARGKGLGAAVVQAFQQASAAVAVPMTLTVLQENTAAKVLYQRLGFVTTAIQQPYELMIWYPPAMQKIII
ncbi:ribosomal protein S18 acetylase RimI-like enzyme [Rheinheimera pacifica]|uniref:GNAT family N-acetyltransferase n=1 Tax=Rheinheimera pacifica TaxID=173990 RepID=UPI002168D529|nr:GNAT family N-acetyltransferase [Rheinheimera pacifica]MCS4306608.1 ribosomal protein S18 acetylase RimI-like enzyme [Rheinheimera pacifica]